MNKLWQLQCELNRYASIQGYCDELANIIRAKVEPLCDEITMLPAANLVCHVKGKGSPLLLWANMAAEGFYISGRDELGYFRARTAGLCSLDYENILLRTCDGKPCVLRTIKKRDQNVAGDNCFYLDFGDNDDVLPMLGDPVIFNSEAYRLNDQRVMTPFGTSITPCVILMRIMEKANNWGQDVYFIFAEGAVGASRAAYAISPSQALGITTINADDGDKRIDDVGLLCPGLGPVLKKRDSCGPVINSSLCNILDKAAKKCGIPLQYDYAPVGDVGYGNLQVYHGGVVTAALALPMRSSFSPAAIYDLSDAMNIVALVDEAFFRKEEAE